MVNWLGVSAYFLVLDIIFFLLLLFLPILDNASRYCFSNGTWLNYTNYGGCVELHEKIEQFHAHIEEPASIYLFGYVVSLILLTIALVIFIYFKWVLHYYGLLSLPFKFIIIQFYFILSFLSYFYLIWFDVTYLVLLNLYNWICVTTPCSLPLISLFCLFAEN